MTAFHIDTGDTHQSGGWKVNVAEIIMDTASDIAGENATQEEIAIAAVPLIVAKFWDAKKPETVRAHLLKMWPIIAPMATTAPDSFDRILQEYAERSNTFR